MSDKQEIRNKLGDFYRRYKSQDEKPANPQILDQIQQLDQRYEKQEKLGEGGLKQVFSAKDLKTNRQVALAFPKDHSDRSLEMFLHEARVTADLNHPNIIPVYDIECGDEIFFTMKKLDGVNLYELLKSKSFTQDSWFLLQVFSKVCDALAFAHSKGVIHLDVKPDNIQVDDFGTVLLIDWGLAASYSDVDEQYMRDFDKGEEVICGTLGYISPEQLNTQEGIVDERSDIYALGALLHYLITGEIPVESQSINPFDSVKQGELRLFTADQKVPMGLKAISEKALALEPEERYQTVQDLKRDLDRYLNGFATSAENAGFAKQLGLLIQRNKKACVTLALVLLLVSVLTSLFIFRLDKEKRQTQLALDETRELKIKSDELRGQAEKNLKRFKAEEQDKMMMVKSSADTLAEQALSNVHEIGVEEALRRIDLGLKAWPDSPSIQFKRLHLLFIGQRFREFSSALAQIDRGPYMDELYSLSLKYAEKKSLEGSLDQESFIELLGELNKKDLRWLLQVFVMLENSKSSSKAVANSLLYFESLYPEQAAIDVTVSGAMIKNLKLATSKSYHDLSALSGLKIELLDVSHVKSISLKSLRHIAIQKLIIKGKTKLDYRQLNFIEGLKSVRVIGGAPEEPEPGLLKDSIELIFEE